MPLVLHVPARELFDESKSIVYDIPAKTLTLEHSLLSISKWEAKWHKPYLPQPLLPKPNQVKTRAEMLDYVRCMTIENNVDPNVYLALSNADLRKIDTYINNPMTATKLAKNQQGRGKDIITNEMIYYWMTALNIPFRPCETWHLNHLLSLIELCAKKNEPKKNMKPNEILKQNSSLNKARRAKHHTKG